MNTDKEILFNYFEGNLNASDEANLLDRVANDIKLEQEFEFWRKSYVEPVQLTYPNKSALLKPWYHSLTVKIAGGGALVATLIGCFFILRNTDEHTLQEPAESIHVHAALTTPVPIVQKEEITPTTHHTAHNPTTELRETLPLTNYRISTTEPIYKKELVAVLVDQVEPVKLMEFNPATIPVETSTTKKKTNPVKTKKKHQFRRKISMRERMHMFSSNLKKIKWTKEETVPIEGF